MFEKPVLETARERAARVWRNNYIQNQIKYNLPEDTNISQSLNDERRINQIVARLSHEIKKALTPKNNTQVITYYLASIRARKMRLLQDKLRRIEESNQHE